MDKIEKCKNWVKFWIWFQFSSGVCVGLHRDTCQILDLQDKNIVTNAIV